MRLSDGMGPTFSGPGSPGPRRRWGRKKTLATALAVTAATGLAGLAGLTQATGASAATVGSTSFAVRVDDADNWKVGWGQAWRQCKQNHPNTKSVEFTGSKIDYAYDGTPADAVQTWKCRDTP